MVGFMVWILTWVRCISLKIILRMKLLGEIFMFERNPFYPKLKKIEKFILLLPRSTKNRFLFSIASRQEP